MTGGPVIVNRRTGMVGGGLILLLLLVLIGWLIYTNRQLDLRLNAALRSATPGTGGVTASVGGSQATPEVLPAAGVVEQTSQLAQTTAGGQPEITSQQTPTAPQVTGGGGITNGAIERTSDGSIRLFVLNPEGGEQTQIRHPAIYSQTNISGNPVRYVLDVPANYIGIVGGFNVDGHGGGVYQAMSPGQHTRTVTDGFALIVRRGWAVDEWNFRLGQAREKGWALGYADPGPLR